MNLDQKIMKNLSGTVFNSIAQIWFFVAKRWILKKGRECVMLLIIYLLKKGLENKLATQRHALFRFKGLFVIWDINQNKIENYYYQTCIAIKRVHKED